MNKNMRRLAESGSAMHLLALVAFAVATLLMEMYELAAVEAGDIEPTRHESYRRLYEKAKEIKLWELK